jgi:1,4-alpha-glucan branching enzyme
MSTYDVGGKPPYTAWENQQYPPVSFDVSLLTQDDLYLFNEGTHYRLYNKLGAHPLTANDTYGTYFAVWAPNATQVSVMGEFNHWDKASHALRPRGQSGDHLQVSHHLPVPGVSSG